MPLGARSGSSRRWVSCLAPLPVRPAAAEPLRAGDAPADQPRWPQLRSLRGLMEEVYRLFDRRCRMATALAKLEKLRRGCGGSAGCGRCSRSCWRRGGEARCSGRATAGATSNAVERGNRRYRKMQKTVYRVRTQRAIEGRLCWTCCGSSTPKAAPDDQDPAPGKGGMMR